MPWYQDRRFHIAIGITTVFLLLRFLFTGNLSVVGDYYFVPEDPEKPKSIDIVPVLFQMAISFFAIVGSSVVLWVTKIWARIADLVDGYTETRTATKAEPGSKEELKDALFEAASEGRRDELDRLVDFTRKPKAVTLLTREIREGRLDEAEKLFAEIKRLEGQTSPTKRKEAAK